MSLILRLLAVIFGGITALRNRCYDLGILKSFKSKLPVICIGNLTAGGSGKTPLSLLIVSTLLELGQKPVILSRGYGGSKKGPHLVSESDTAATVGDEPLLIARKKLVPVVISRDRTEGARMIEREQIGSIIVLDDGFQHRRLARDLDMILIDCSSSYAITSFLSAQLLPLGRFREYRRQAFCRAGAVILSHRRPRQSALDTANVRKSIPVGIPILESFAEIQSVYEISTKSPLPDGYALLPFCALGNPEGFLATVQVLGTRSGHKILPPYLKADHRRFDQAELRLVLQTSPGATLICTEKDAVKLPPLDFPVFVLEMRVEIDEPARLRDLMSKQIS